jgi:hypothetical protein
MAGKQNKLINKKVQTAEKVGGSKIPCEEYT